MINEAALVRKEHAASCDGSVAEGITIKTAHEAVFVHGAL
jgi:hypothetical protein